MTKADRIRQYGTERYVLPARKRGMTRFSIRTGEVHRELGLEGRHPAVCSALKTGKFLEQNQLRLVETIAPKSGQSSTVTYTYEFVEMVPKPPTEGGEVWKQLRGALRDIFAEFGGGEAYVRAERSNFGSVEDRK